MASLERDIITNILAGDESGIGRTEGDWKFPERTERSVLSSGNFQPPEVRPIPDSPNLQVCLVFITCHFGKILKSTEEFYTHNFLLFSI
jgi:hypothetical protein